MLRIKMNEARFTSTDNLVAHYDKHVDSNADGFLRMDNMTMDEYDELSELLSDAEAEDVDIENQSDALPNDGVVGYVSNDGRYNKYDTDSNIYTCYTKTGTTISTYKTNDRRMNKTIKGDKNAKYGYKEDLPEEEKDGNDFSYNKFKDDNDFLSRDKTNELVKKITHIGAIIDQNKCDALIKFFFNNKLDNCKKKTLFVPMLAKNANYNPAEDDDKIAAALRQVGVQKTFYITGIYDTEDVKALYLKSPSKANNQKISNVDDYILIVASSPDFKKADLKVDNFKMLEQQISITGVLGYKLQSSKEIYTEVK